MLKKENIKGRFRDRKLLKVVAAVFATGIIITVICLKIADGNEKVSFEAVKENDIPQEIISNVIPEYKTLERALACVDNNDIYVIVTRGEKPTSGYKVGIESMEIEKEGKVENLIVYASFGDPESKTSISQIITYPLQVVKTDLKRLPDTIELRIQYE